jgi:hypothetical protein
VNPVADLVTTAGDTLYATAADTLARLGIGTAGQVLQVNSGATAPEWATPSGANSSWTLLNSGGTALNGSANVSVTGITGADKILVMIQYASSTVAQSGIAFRINNSSTASDYSFSGGAVQSKADTNLIVQANNSFSSENRIRFCQMPNSAASGFTGSLMISGGASTGNKAFTVMGAADAGSGVADALGYFAQGIFGSTTTVSSVQVLTDQGNFDGGGRIYVYTSVS